MSANSLPFLDPVAASSPQVSSEVSDKAAERRERAAQRKSKASSDKPPASKKYVLLVPTILHVIAGILLASGYM